MAEGRTSRDTRGLFRKELFEYQKRKLFGEPIHVQPPAAWWCLGPIAAICALACVVSTVSYRPSLRGRVVPSTDGATGVLSVVDDANALSDIRAGDAIRFELSDHGAYRLEVATTTTARCGSSARCLEIAGALAAPDGPPRARLPGPAWVQLLLPARTLFSGWKR